MPDNRRFEMSSIQSKIAKTQRSKKLWLLKERAVSGSTCSDDSDFGISRQHLKIGKMNLVMYLRRNVDIISRWGTSKGEKIKDPSGKSITIKFNIWNKILTED